MIVTRQMGE